MERPVPAQTAPEGTPEASPTVAPPAELSLVEAQAAGLPVLCSEMIPQEAIITNQIMQLELSAGTKKWAEKLLKMDCSERISGAAKVVKAGFDIQAVAGKIEAKWRGEAFEARENIRYRPCI